MIERDKAQAKLEHESECAFDHGHYVGSLEERNDIKDFIIDMLVFAFKDKIEPGTIDSIIGKIERAYPEMEMKHAEDFQ